MDLPKLSELGVLRTGHQLRGAAQYDPLGVNVLIQQGDLRDDGIDIGRDFRMTLERPGPNIVRLGDVLLRGRGANYGAVVVPDVPADTVAISPLVVFRPHTMSVLPEYVAWFINRPATQAVLNAAAHGTHIPTVSRQAFAELSIVLPPLPVQAQIAETDDLLRRERRLTEQLLDKREQVAQAHLETFFRRQDAYDEYRQDNSGRDQRGDLEGV